MPFYAKLCHLNSLCEFDPHCLQQKCCAEILDLVSGDMTFVWIFAGYWNGGFRQHYGGG